MRAFNVELETTRRLSGVVTRRCSDVRSLPPRAVLGHVLASDGAGAARVLVGLAEPKTTVAPLGLALGIGGDPALLCAPGVERQLGGLIFGPDFATLRLENWTL